MPGAGGLNRLFQVSEANKADQPDASENVNKAKTLSCLHLVQSLSFAKWLPSDAYWIVCFVLVFRQMSGVRYILNCASCRRHHTDFFRPNCPRLTLSIKIVEHCGVSFVFQEFRNVKRAVIVTIVKTQIFTSHLCLAMPFALTSAWKKFESSFHH